MDQLQDVEGDIQIAEAELRLAELVLNEVKPTGGQIPNKRAELAVLRARLSLEKAQSRRKLLTQLHPRQAGQGAGIRGREGPRRRACHAGRRGSSKSARNRSLSGRSRIARSPRRWTATSLSSGRSRSIRRSARESRCSRSPRFSLAAVKALKDAPRIGVEPRGICHNLESATSFRSATPARASPAPVDAPALRSPFLALVTPASPRILPK